MSTPPSGEVPTHPPGRKPGGKWISDGAALGAGVMGFIGWVVVFWILVIATESFNGATGTSGAVYYALLVALLGGAVGLVVWPRTRRMGQGLLLALSVGFIIAGGICVPLVVGAV
ncbi:hypothetical protein LL946_02275 [Knoellia locipacati]|uniref:hypothetical protein n=1 Tax=Knoellia locipacati TaxID=882824 RepID=UPI00384EFA79